MAQVLRIHQQGELLFLQQHQVHIHPIVNLMEHTAHLLQLTPKSQRTRYDTITLIEGKTCIKRRGYTCGVHKRQRSLCEPGSVGIRTSNRAKTRWNQGEKGVQNSPKMHLFSSFFQVKLGDMSLTPLNLIESTQEHTLSPAYSGLSTSRLAFTPNLRGKRNADIQYTHHPVDRPISKG